MKGVAHLAALILAVSCSVLPMQAPTASPARVTPSRTFPIRGQESRKCRETPMFFGKVCTMGLDLGACDFRWWLRWEL